ncbi:8-oxoguanine deaminase [Gluconacetobacter entanii]|uniref:8-oxoguanine deaminase n=1 Tax=Gluconacetobacter entanii TaxID=108528 RepID=UPI001C934F6C|nr:8-oxoguanine deaminase [Gluconacetobacter entanii]MBY4641601.1 8-oxoguanine deaminase [Gluconacetobacter entanii]MCW4579365.1 8-oxoguanine deaminase [Gluconacetobacter entanii]MCW4582755.1 8-oxoguanine deaminase [Gluconacetobacter entanii]MCW4586169.1 8-oxoguanine deaminase [Gluconacetobacter entanii]
MPRSILLKNALMLVTMDAQRREIAGGWVLIQGRQIQQVGTPHDPLPAADDVMDMSGHLVMPGLINTHHHMYQTLTRVVPAAQDVSLFGWLRTLYPIWARLTPDMIRVSTRTAMAELLLSGCTTSSDHLYLFPNGSRLDDQIEAAATMGMRFHAARGAMSVGESAGGLPPDSLVEDEPSILRDMQRVVEAYHDPSRLAMQRIVLAPCSPFSVSRDLMRQTAHLARATGTRLHTHLAENASDIEYSRDAFGMTPAEYAEDTGWMGPDVWHAHCVRLDHAGIERFGRTGTGVAHCPCSNMRLGSGIAPVRRMMAHGVNVGLGVDGSASNDSSHMLAEARQAMLVSRLMHDQEDGAAMMGARTALELATRGGAAVLGRDDIGHLSAGMAADVVAFDLRGIDHAGALVDPVAALVFCTPRTVALSLINGQVVVRDGHLLTCDTRQLAERHNHLARALLDGDDPV